MRSILRFLCVAVMLQVSTPFVHGMKEEAGEKREYGEKVARFWSSANSKIVLRDSCTKVMCASLALMAIFGCVYSFVQPFSEKTPSINLHDPLKMCRRVNWDRREAICEELDGHQIDWAIAVCQAHLMEDGCVPVCNDIYSEYAFPAGALSRSERKICSEKLNLNEYDFPACIVCSHKVTPKMEKVLGNLKIPFCSKRTYRNSRAFAIPYSKLEVAVNFTAYEEQIVGHAEDIGDVYCREAVEGARMGEDCRGSITYNANATNRKRGKHRKPRKRHD